MGRGISAKDNRYFQKLALEKMMKDQMPTICTVRDGEDEIHLECRFPDGQKFAAVIVAAGYESLAQFLANAINTRTTTPTKGA